MTRKSVDEYSKAIRDRYLKESKEENGKILDEFARVTGIHRKAAIRLFDHVSQHNKPKRRGKRKYDTAVGSSLKTIWEASDRLCSKRLKLYMPHGNGFLVMDFLPMKNTIVRKTSGNGTPQVNSVEEAGKLIMVPSPVIEECQ